MANRWSENQTPLARRFFLATIAQAGVCIALAVSLGLMFGAPPPAKQLYLPPAFLFGTIFLLAGSWFLQIAGDHVRQERQNQFRQALVRSLVFAILFVGVQSFGLWSFARGTTDSQNPQLNAHGFVFMFTALHAMHFLVAQSVLLWVTLAAYHDRYDHEYYFGVTFAKYFWHVLGLAWIAILFVFSIAAS
ncbi:MAG: hypothetical protein Fues2KO_36960 [Fuerstiella sp.]